MKRLLLILLLILSFAAFGQMNTKVLPYSNFEYIEYTPPDAVKPRAIIVFLHGLGEVGRGISAVEKNEIPALFKLGIVKEYIVLAPYLESGTQWPKNRLLSILDLIETYKLKTGIDKVVITGLSLGGIGTIATLYWANEKFKRNDYFTAAGIVCGKTGYTDMKPFVGIPIKAWHGVNDSQLPISNMRTFVKRVKDAGGNIELVEYPGVNHNAWDYAYRDGDNEFWAWLDKIIPKQEPEPVKHFDGVVFQEGEDIFFKSEAGTYKLQATKQ
jgi:predicted peptidase